MGKHELFIQQCETDIRSGQGHLAARKLSNLSLPDIDDDDRLHLARLSRRAGLATLGLKILTPIVHPESKGLKSPPSPLELSEYAVCLQRIGVVKEALRVLESLSHKAPPEAFLYRSFCHFNSWEYEESVPLLESYLASIEAPYARLVGEINLASALVSLRRDDEAFLLLERILNTCAGGGFARLLANCHEMKAQVHLARGDLTDAEGHLDAAAKIFGSDTTLDQLFVQKWQAVLTSRRSGTVDALLAFRREATKRRDWESLRETDFQILKLEFDQKKFDHLIFGTPFSRYRARIMKEIPYEVSSPTYLFGDPNGRRMDLISGTVDGKTSLNGGKKIHQVIEVLMRDFYRPLQMGGLFVDLFPEERFNVFTSPNRVHQILARTRKWLVENEIPVRIDNTDADYGVVLEGSFAFSVPLDRNGIDSRAVALERLKNALLCSGSRSFTPMEAQDLLEFSESSFKRFARWAMTEGHLEKSKLGGGRVAYRLKLRDGELNAIGKAS